MRSDLVYSAGGRIENRFLLATVTSRIVRKLHVASTRTQDTASRALSDISQGVYGPINLPRPARPAVIEPLLIPPEL